MTVRPADTRRGLALAFAMGGAAALSAAVFDIPGRGEFIALTWLAGFAAMFVAPGVRGFLAVVAGATAIAALVDVSDGAFGLVWLVAAIAAVVAAHGALAGSVIRRLRTLGLSKGLRDRGVLAGGGLALGLLLVFVWLADEFRRNPP